jgi:hypothetical protein
MGGKFWQFLLDEWRPYSSLPQEIFGWNIGTAILPTVHVILWGSAAPVKWLYTGPTEFVNE